MERVCGYLACTESLTIAGRQFELVMPADSDGLLDDPRVAARFERDEYMPYWATLWPAAVLLAEIVGQWPPAPSTDPPHVLELGCGLGLVGLVAASRGYRVTLSDYDADALAFARVNATRNGLDVLAMRVVDWRQDYSDLRAARILAADVLYEARNLQPVATFLRRHLSAAGLALVTDANRSTADAFPAAARAAGLAVSVTVPASKQSWRGRPLAGRLFTCTLENL